MNQTRFEAHLAQELSELSQAGLRRQRRTLESPCGREVIVRGNTLINFASNDYLGLSNNREIAQALADGALAWGPGSGASHLVSGHLTPHAAIEAALADFVGFEQALTFSTGYLANLAVTPTLAGRGDAIFADKLNHASLIDAMQLAKANGADVARYPHSDLIALERLLAKTQARNKLIVTDSVFSMDGDLAPIPALLTLAERYDAWLLIDDAHAFGVLGQHGEGSIRHFGLPASARVLLMGTLGKAAGVGGAFVAGSALAIEYLLNKSRSYIFTTAAPPAIACAQLCSLNLVKQGDELRSRLFSHIARLRDGLRPLRWQLLPSNTAIQPLIIGENEAALSLSQALWQRGIWAPAIRPPTVPKGSARLRISLSAAHTDQDIDSLIAALKELS